MTNQDGPSGLNFLPAVHDSISRLEQHIRHFEPRPSEAVHVERGRVAMLGVIANPGKLIHFVDFFRNTISIFHRLPKIRDSYDGLFGLFRKVK